MRKAHFMAVLIVLAACNRCMADERVGTATYCESPKGGFPQRIHPAGGWFPYTGGLLHWWDPSCYPHCGGPDDYCRKPLPRLCWPGPYPSSYIWGPPETCCPQSKHFGDCNKSH